MSKGKRSGDRKEYEYTRLGAQVQNVKQSKVYVFGDGDVEEAEDDVLFEMTQIRTRKKKANQNHRREEGSLFVERKITQDDTLQKLSLQYSCPIAELKRINNLMTEQDFYGLVNVKIPVKRHSFLIDEIEKEARDLEKKEKPTTSHVPNGAMYIGSDTETEFDESADLSDPEKQRKVIREISIGGSSARRSPDATEFFHQMDVDLSRIANSKRTDRNSLDEVISVLTNKSVRPLLTPKEQSDQLYLCRITSWKIPLLILLLVSIIAPVAFLIYFLRHSS